MSSPVSLVLARKYRPRSFEQLVGQEHVVQALANALRSQRLHHAYLFTGTRGVGKTTISRLLAKSLNCVGPDGSGGITAQPCGVCASCRDIDAGRHVDYVELDAASNRGVEEISQLLDQAVYKPVVGRFKVYMIDEVHMLSNTAFNAMLKTLEEPPEYLKFVLATTDPQKVPPTVLSRCLQFNLRPMAPQTVQAYLQHVLGEEGIEAQPGALRLLSRAAQGSMRDGLSLTDQAIAFGAGRLDEAGVRQMLGAVDRGHGVRILEALAAGDGAALVASVDGLRALGLSASGLLEELAATLQQMAVLQAVPGALDESDPDAPTVLRLSTLFAPDETQLYYSIAVHGRAELALAPDEYSGLVMSLLRMLAFKPASTGGRVPAPDLLAKAPLPTARATSAALVAAAAPRAASPVPPAPVPPREVPYDRPYPAEALRAESPVAGFGASSTTAAIEAATSVAAAVNAAAPASVSVSALAEPRAADADTRALTDRWAALVARLVEAGSIAAMVRELAMQAQLLAVERDGAEAVWRLRVERESLRSPTQRDKLQAALSNLLNEALRLELEPGVAEDSPALRDLAERRRRQQEAERIIHDDPLVQSLMQQYKTARIVPGSIKFH